MKCAGDVFKQKNDLFIGPRSKEKEGFIGSTSCAVHFSVLQKNATIVRKKMIINQCAEYCSFELETVSSEYVPIEELIFYANVPGLDHWSKILKVSR